MSVWWDDSEVEPDVLLRQPGAVLRGEGAVAVHEVHISIYYWIKRQENLLSYLNPPDDFRDTRDSIHTDY